jgi:hypothetical protein
MPDHLPAEMTDAQKLEFMREWLMNVSWAMRDLRAGIQILHENIGGPTRQMQIAREEAASLTATTGDEHICAARDGKTAPIERRNRGKLGPGHTEFEACRARRGRGGLLADRLVVMAGGICTTSTRNSAALSNTASAAITNRRRLY